MSVSDVARELARLRGEIGPISVVRRERVAGLKDLLAKGQYSPDLSRVARGFLRETLAQLLS